MFFPCLPAFSPSLTVAYTGEDWRIPPKEFLFPTEGMGLERGPKVRVKQGA